MMKPQESTESESLNSEQSPNKTDKVGLVLVIVMFVLFVVAAGLAVFFYMDDDCASEECLGMILPQQCETLVDCEEENGNIEEEVVEISDTEDETEDSTVVNQDVNVERLSFTTGPTNFRQENEEYFITFDYCTEWKTNETQLPDSRSRYCVETEPREYMFDPNGIFVIGKCTDEGNIHDFYNIGTDNYFDGISLDYFEPGDCLGLGQYGFNIVVVGGNRIVSLTNHYN